MVSNKILLAIVIVAVAITIFAMAVIADIGGLGKMVSGAGGPFAKGIYNIVSGVPKWALSGGWPTLAVTGLIFVVIIPCLAAYTTWHYDLPYKVTGSSAPTGPASGYDNTMAREPEEPERGAKPV